MNERGPGAAPETGVTGDDRATGALRTQQGSGVNTQPNEKIMCKGPRAHLLLRTFQSPLCPPSR